MIGWWSNAIWIKFLWQTFHSSPVNVRYIWVWVQLLTYFSQLALLFFLQQYWTVCYHWIRVIRLYQPQRMYNNYHDAIIKGNIISFPRYWPFVRGIHRSPVNSPHKGQWHRALMFSTPWINGWVNNREAGDLRRHRPHYDVIVMMAAYITMGAVMS